MIIQSGQKQSGRFFAEASELEVRWSVDSQLGFLRLAPKTSFILSLIGLVAVLIGCGQAVLEKRLAGTWFVRNGVIKFAEDGTFESWFTNQTGGWAYEGRWLTRSNMLSLTMIKSNGVPCYGVTDCKIIRADGSRMIYSVGDQIVTLVRKGAEPKPPQSFAALEKAKKIQLSDVKFDHLPLAAVITMLQDESVKRDAARKGVTISLGPDAKQLADAEINLELRDITLAETLGRVAESVGLEVQATDTELLLLRKE